MIEVLDASVAMIAASVTPAVAMVLVMDGSGRARGGRWLPRGGRDVFALVVVVSAFSVPAVLAGPMPVALPVAAAAGVIARGLAGGPAAGLAWGAGVTALTITVDVAAGSALLERAGLAGIDGSVDPWLTGVAIGGALVASAAALDRGERPMRPAAAAVLAATIWVLIAPALGDSAAALWAGAPAVAAFVLMSAGPTTPRRMILRALIVIAVFQSALSVGDVDLARSGDRSLLDVGSVGLLALAFAALALLVGWRIGDARARAMFGRPHLRAAIVACVIGAIGSGNVPTAVGLLVWAAAASAVAMLVGD